MFVGLLPRSVVFGVTNGLLELGAGAEVGGGELGAGGAVVPGIGVEAGVEVATGSGSVGVVSAGAAGVDDGVTSVGADGVEVGVAAESAGISFKPTGGVVAAINSSVGLPVNFSK